MKITIVLIVAIILLAPMSFAVEQDKQNQASASAAARGDAKSQGEASAKSGDIKLDAGTQIQAETSSTLDLKKARPGDKFKMKTKRPVKRDGKEVIGRGSVISGHIEQITRAENTTTARLIFDEIQDKKTGATASLEAIVTAVTKVERHPPDTMSSDPVTPPPTGNRRESSGGLLGGVVETVGGVTGQVGSTVDSTVSVGPGVGATAGGLTGSTVRIVTDTTTEVTSGTTLAVPNRNAKIESGTEFVLKTTSELVFASRPGEKSDKKN